MPFKFLIYLKHEYGIMQIQILHKIGHEIYLHITTMYALGMQFQ